MLKTLDGEEYKSSKSLRRNYKHLALHEEEIYPYPSMQRRHFSPKYGNHHIMINLWLIISSSECMFRNPCGLWTTEIVVLLHMQPRQYLSSTLSLNHRWVPVEVSGNPKDSLGTTCWLSSIVGKDQYKSKSPAEILPVSGETAWAVVTQGNIISCTHTGMRPSWLGWAE